MVMGTRGAMKQAYAEVFLKSGHCFAYGGSRDVEFATRFGKTSDFCRPYKCTQCAE